MSEGAGLERLLAQSGIPAGAGEADLLRRYLRLLQKWNGRINLTARGEWDAIEPLVREGVWSAGLYPPGERFHLDIGSGAGFPALILRIFNPGMKLEMVESRGKKAAFLETAAWELGFGEVRVHAERLEAFLRRSATDKRWDSISWKAIRLSGAELEALRLHSGAHTRFWMFHGASPAGDPEALRDGFGLEERRPVPGTKGAWLSIYAPAEARA
ncbi:MAG: class I SAM-dependent methyltransferase [Acidobacteria bacterium]|nr:class I SAM-dependent methyltransferase [Acidobacteriota bacterium]